MISERATYEWADDRRKAKHSTEHAEQFRAVLQAGDLSYDLYHGDNYIGQSPAVSKISNARKK